MNEEVFELIYHVELEGGTIETRKRISTEPRVRAHLVQIVDEVLSDMAESSTILIRRVGVPAQ